MNDSRFDVRGKGDGKITEHIHAMIHLAKKKYFKDKAFTKPNTDLHERYKDA
ncbi:hypothetical protein [Sediminicola arcticus]|uniref:Uncharacterized protein n=1 Tax=Sediminicola arcticus TaxID=1574308 RepID=A0ABV2SR77_9FLAO